MAGDTRAQHIIHELNSKGYNNSDIAKLIGRDSSTISQISRGKKSGAHYVDALNKINAGNKQVTIPRRQTKSGVQANVRRGAIRDNKRRVIQLDTKSPNGTQVSNLLKHAADKNAIVGVVAQFKKLAAYGDTSTSGSITLWKHGYSAKAILKMMNNHSMSFGDLVVSNANNMPFVEHASGLENVTINIIYPD